MTRRLLTALVALVVIGLDRYHLVVSDNGQGIGGITESQNTWQGVLSTTRTP